MNIINLYNKISLLKDELKSELSQFIDTLLVKVKLSSDKKKPVFACGKGFFVLHGDFDEQMEDFKKYMNC